MLTLTEAARNVIRLIPEETRYADTAGLRIERPDEDAEGLTVTPADEPAHEDHVVEDDGARVFLDPDAADRLEDTRLDAQFDSRGRIHFHSAPVG